MYAQQNVQGVYGMAQQNQALMQQIKIEPVNFDARCEMSNDPVSNHLRVADESQRLRGN